MKLLQELNRRFSESREDEMEVFSVGSSQSTMTLGKTIGYGRLGDKYTEKDGNDGHTKFTEDSPTKYIIHPKNPPVVWLCPHEQLSFERLQRIINLPDFKTNANRIDALTACAAAHQQALHRSSERHFCQPECHCARNIIWGSGTYTYRQDQRLFAESGLELRFHWCIVFKEKSEVDTSFLRMQAWLEETKIWLCPHLKLSDDAVVEKLASIMQPEYKAVDPVQSYERIHQFGGKGKTCEQCRTTTSITGLAGGSQVNVMRFFGRGKTAHGRQWLSQCGVRKHSYGRS